MVTVKEAERSIFNTKCPKFMDLHCYGKMCVHFLGRVKSPWSCNCIYSWLTREGFGLLLQCYQATVPHVIARLLTMLFKATEVILV